MLRVLALVPDSPVATAVAMELDASGLDVATVSHPDLLAHVRMGGVDGFLVTADYLARSTTGAADLLVGLRRPTLVLAMNLDSTRDRALAQRFEFGDCLVRPFSPRDVVRALYALIETHRRSTGGAGRLDSLFRGLASEPP